MSDIPIIYENEEIYIINKPCGLPVQGGEKIRHSLDVDFAQQVGQKIFLVHRLDKETAGLMVVAKNSVAAGKWTKLIGSKQVHKEYVAICCGKINPKQGCIKDDLIQHGEVKYAETYYQVEKEWTKVLGEDNVSVDFSKISLRLETGRMHQIRIHLAKNGCPICGDDQHGNFKLNKLLKKTLKIKHLLLFSVKLELPLNNKITAFQIPLPEEYEML
ncbi:MAG: RNA pseudouridine synthase [Treponema sp.]|nr:RNA pseudouridine synthase [Treponema sp.]